MKRALAVSVRQKGVVIILFVLALFLTGSAVVLSALNNRQPQLDRAQDQQVDLRQAKEALIAFAMLYPQNFNGGPGRLPCGDSDNDGLPNACANTMSRLPQRVTLASGERYAISDIASGYDQQPWYFVDASVRSSVATVHAGSALSSGISVDGTSNIVAVLIAPGEPFSTQTRPNNTIGNYLEAPNNALAAFTNNLTTTRNDRVIPIFRDELLSATTAMAAAEMRRLLDANHPLNGSAYAADLAAFQAVMDAANNWLDGNSWHTTGLASYVRNNANSASFSFQNCAITYTVNFGSPNIGRSASSC
jgi:hypothetical protein